jgi:type III restriction enzyme
LQGGGDLTTALWWARSIAPSHNYHPVSLLSELIHIFSHSALKEGWDNPNIFQICTLNETQSVIKKRQEIGRGLRICVNQDGERVHGFEVNTLTVMVNESYEDFAEGLQKEIEQEESIRFGIIEEHTFADIIIHGETREDRFLGATASEQIWKHLLEQKYIDQQGKVTDELRKDLKTGAVALPAGFAAQAGQINAKLKKIAGGLDIKNNDDKRIVQYA